MFTLMPAPERVGILCGRIIFSRHGEVVGIRGRLLVLAVVVAVPLAFVGVADMRGVWRSNRSQLDEALRQQAETA